MRSKISYLLVALVVTSLSFSQKKEKIKELLEKEKIKVQNETVVDFDKLFWDPMTELL